MNGDLSDLSELTSRPEAGLVVIFLAGLAIFSVAKNGDGRMVALAAIIGVPAVYAHETLGLFSGGDGAQFAFLMLAVALLLTMSGVLD